MVGASFVVEAELLRLALLALSAMLRRISDWRQLVSCTKNGHALHIKLKHDKFYEMTESKSVASCEESWLPTTRLWQRTPRRFLRRFFDTPRRFVDDMTNVTPRQFLTPRRCSNLTQVEIELIFPTIAVTIGLQHAPRSQMLLGHIPMLLILRSSTAQTSVFQGVSSHCPVILTLCMHK